MGFGDALDISVSGIEAERRTQELIASNIANINTTRTVFGGPYRRKMGVRMEEPLSFSDELRSATVRLEGAPAGGVKIVDVIDDRTPFQKVYKPGHPDADGQGYVLMPNVTLANEMTDMIEVSKLYEANITAFNVTKKMMQDTLQLQ